VDARAPRALSRDSGLPRLEVSMLWQHILGVSRTWLVAHDDEAVSQEAATAFATLAARRRHGEPMAYLLGEREFMGHRFAVAPGVLIPRPDTEVLVETALACIAGLENPSVIDLGTGSGAIAVSIALARSDAAVTATDYSDTALKIAIGNAHTLQARVNFVQGDWYQAVPADARFDLIVSNPPYIASDDHHLDQGDLRFEPSQALTDGGDGLQALAILAAGASGRLKPGGQIWLEHGWDQAEAVRKLLTQAGLRDASSRRDLAGIERISGASL
jgi:release factor glutamine methyltransferase